MKRVACLAVVAGVGLFLWCGGRHEPDVRRFSHRDRARSIERLIEAVRQSETVAAGPELRAAALNDLAIAHTEIARGGSAKSLVLALDAVEKAWALDHTRSIASTRAKVFASIARNAPVATRRPRATSVIDLPSIVPRRPGFEMLEQYDRLIEVSMAAGDRERAAAVLVLRAETLSAMGSADEAWLDLSKARELSDAPTVIQALGIAAARDGHVYAARALFDDALPDVDDRVRAQLSLWRAFAETLIARRLLGVHVAVPAQLPPAVVRRYLRNGRSDVFDGQSIIHAASHRVTPDLHEGAAAAVIFAESVQNLYETDSRTAIANNSPLAALWFSDVARRAILPRGGRTSCVEPGDGKNAEVMGRRLVQCVPKDVTLVHQDLDVERLNTWVIRDGDIAFTSTPVSALRLQAEIDRLVSGIAKETPAANIRKQAHNLYDILLRPVEQQIAGTNLLVYSPSANLRNLPIGALRDANGFLVERRPIMTTTTISTFEVPQALPRQALALVVLPTAAPRVRELLGANREVRDVNRIYGANGNLRTGNDATPEAFLAMAPKYDILHLSSHGYLSDLPYQNAIDFGPRRIRAYDVLQLRLDHAPVVMLAACRTATQSGGPANLSLANAFLAAGASAVVGSLWNVEDLDTAELSVAFHRELARGASPHDALRTVQVRFIRSGMPPRAWAAFQVGT